MKYRVDIVYNARVNEDDRIDLTPDKTIHQIMKKCGGELLGCGCYMRMPFPRDLQFGFTSKDNAVHARKLMTAWTQRPHGFRSTLVSEAPEK